MNHLCLILSMSARANASPSSGSGRAYRRSKDGNTALILTRQNELNAAAGLERGAEALDVNLATALCRTCNSSAR